MLGNRDGGSSMKKPLLSAALAVVMAVCLVECRTTYQVAIGTVEECLSDETAKRIETEE